MNKTDNDRGVRVIYASRGQEARCPIIWWTMGKLKNKFGVRGRVILFAISGLVNRLMSLVTVFIQSLHRCKISPFGVTQDINWALNVGGLSRDVTAVVDSLCPFLRTWMHVDLIRLQLRAGILLSLVLSLILHPAHCRARLIISQIKFVLWCTFLLLDFQFWVIELLVVYSNLSTLVLEL